MPKIRLMHVGVRIDRNAENVETETEITKWSTDRCRVHSSLHKIMANSGLKRDNEYPKFKIRSSHFIEPDQENNQ